MSWLFKQVWVWILVAFLLGLILTWVYVVRGSTHEVDDRRDGRPPLGEGAPASNEELGSEPPAGDEEAGAAPDAERDLPTQQHKMGATDVTPSIVHDDGREHQGQARPDPDDLPAAGQAETVTPAEGQVDASGQDTQSTAPEAAEADREPEAPQAAEPEPEPEDAPPPEPAPEPVAQAEPEERVEQPEPEAPAPPEPEVEAVSEPEPEVEAVSELEPESQPETPVEPDPITEQFGAGAASPRADGSSPSPAYTIKGDAETMMFHTPDSPQFDQVEAEIWFTDEQTAASAGFLPARR